MSLVYGKEYLQIAEILRIHREDDCSEVTRSKEYQMELQKYSSLYEDLKRSLPDDLRTKLIGLDDAQGHFNAIWQDWHYEQGFLDGLVVMQAILYKLCQAPIDSEIPKIIHGVHVRQCRDGKSPKVVREILDSLISLTEECEKIKKLSTFLNLGQIAALVRRAI